MWYVFFKDQTWKDGVSCRDEQEAREMESLGNGNIIAEYHEG